MLYELVGITRCNGPNGIRDSKDVVMKVGKMIVNNRGIVRKIENWGLRPLPKVINKNRQSNLVGAHFFIKFDASPSAQSEIQRSLRTDPRILRSLCVKDNTPLIGKASKRAYEF